ncbi:fungal-specific transcription factor domain-containing protein [Paraphoma chrysanthemicola]|nr:fungal-specific transcription factor domain-containing protein [Paraphoma chrysanthemicola]
MPPRIKVVEPSSAGSGSGSARAKPTPKERGCFQCSRRRIICDKAEPSCGKCIKKGIDCSGVNRIRFTEGVARRGRLKDCKIPDISNNGQGHLPSTTSFPAIRWNNEKKKVSRRKKGETRRDVIEAMSPSSAHPSDEISQLACTPRTTSPTDFPDDFVDTPPQLTLSPALFPTLDDDVEEIDRAEDNVQLYFSAQNNLQYWLPPLSAEARMLFSYFSEAIAPVMVVLDTISNGYRQHILPMALEDEVLRRAVGVVAAQHLSRERPEIKEAAEAGRVAVISRLRKDAISASEDQVFSKFTWATLVVLLVGETVTGSEDYSFLVQMLLCLSANSRADHDDTATTRFLQTQTNMFELLGLPLLGEDTGVSAIKRSFQSWQDWLTCEQFPADSENHQILDKIRLCFAAACTIYIRRATSENTESSPAMRSQYNQLQASTIQDLIGRLSNIPPHTHGAHALVWPCFVAGAEASDFDQRAFFVSYMESIYARTKFLNIPVAVQSLKALWASKGDKRWTQCLPEYNKVLVM